MLAIIISELNYFGLIFKIESWFLVGPQRPVLIKHKIYQRLLKPKVLLPKNMYIKKIFVLGNLEFFYVFKSRPLFLTPNDLCPARLHTTRGAYCSFVWVCFFFVKVSRDLGFLILFLSRLFCYPLTGPCLSNTPVFLFTLLPWFISAPGFCSPIASSLHLFVLSVHFLYYCPGPLNSLLWQHLLFN